MSYTWEPRIGVEAWRHLLSVAGWQELDGGVIVSGIL